MQTRNFASEVETPGNPDAPRHNPIIEAMGLHMKKDVMNIINSLADNGEASKFMQGHIDQDVMDHTFLVNAEQKVPDSSLAINCKEHNKPAVFFSQQKNSWRCFLCMMNEDGLIYVDKQYKHDMEQFEQIKAATYRTVVENTPYMTLIQNWKTQNRQK